MLHYTKYMKYLSLQKYVEYNYITFPLETKNTYPWAYFGIDG